MSSITITRRRALQMIAAASAAVLGACHARLPSIDTRTRSLQDLERTSGGRLGVFAIDTGSGRELAWRADERFALCSTFKLLLAGLLLQDIDSGRIDGDRSIAFSTDDLIDHAPVIQARLNAGVGAMTVRDLAHAAQVTSDNVAANLLLRELGGPSAFTARLRALGDEITRLDRNEPELNLVPPGEVRDTTTPRAIAHSAGRFVVGSALADASRETLAEWLVETSTGLRRLRAGLPGDWRVGDKTGTAAAAAMANKHNDVAVAWPPGRAPIVIACYFEADGYHPAPRAEDDAVLAQVGHLVAQWAG